VPREQVYAVFLSALRLHGLAAIESGGVTKIVPEADAKQNAGPVIEAGRAHARRPGRDHGLPLQFESAAQIPAGAAAAHSGE
jgi:general secretion pathway protein D